LAQTCRTHSTTHAIVPPTKRQPTGRHFRQEIQIGASFVHFFALRVFPGFFATKRQIDASFLDVNVFGQGMYVFVLANVFHQGQGTMFQGKRRRVVLVVFVFE
jgi:hypothetical protein